MLKIKMFIAKKAQYILGALNNDNVLQLLSNCMNIFN